MAEDHQVLHIDCQQLQAQLITTPPHFLLYNSWIFILLFPLDLPSIISIYKLVGTCYLYLQLLPKHPSWLPDGTLHFSPFPPHRQCDYEGNMKEKMLLLPKTDKSMIRNVFLPSHINLRTPTCFCLELFPNKLQPLSS